METKARRMRYLHIVRHQLLLLTTMLLILCGCNRNDCTSALGESLYRIDPVGDIRSIQLDMVADVYINQDTTLSKNSLEVVAQEQVLKSLGTSENNGRLRIFLRDCIKQHGPITLTLNIDTIEAIGISSAGNVLSASYLNVSNLQIMNDGLGDVDLLVDAEQISCSIETSGTIRLQGSCDRLDVVAKSSGIYRCFDMLADTTDVLFAGFSNIEVFGGQVLNVFFVSDGSVKYRGHPIISTSGVEGEIIDANL